MASVVWERVVVEAMVGFAAPFVKIISSVPAKVTALENSVRTSAAWFREA
jgi:hypothetical protein